MLSLFSNFIASYWARLSIKTYFFLSLSYWIIFPFLSSLLKNPLEIATLFGNLTPKIWSNYFPLCYPDINFALWPSTYSFCWWILSINLYCFLCWFNSCSRLIGAFPKASILSGIFTVPPRDSTRSNAFKNSAEGFII